MIHGTEAGTMRPEAKVKRTAEMQTQNAVILSYK